MLSQDFKNTYILRKTAHAVTIEGKHFIAYLKWNNICTIVNLPLIESKFHIH